MIIVHFGPAALPVTYSRGGAIQRRMLEIAKLQAARGHKVILYSADANRARKVFDGIEIRSITCRRSNIYLRDIEYLVGALRELRDEHVDVCHFHSLPEGAALSGGICGVKVLSYDYFIFRRGKNTPLFWWYRNALQKFARLLPVSEYCRIGSQEYWGLEPGRFRVMHNGVNLEQFSPKPDRGLAKRRALNIGDERVILYVGRVCEQKGTDLLIEAYLRLRQEFPSVRLVVAGPADEFGKAGETTLTRRIAKSGGLYLGAVEERELSSVYNLADIFVMPTRSIEMFGMAAVEAQACGKPVVASRDGGLPEVISEKSGRFFETGNPVALADQLSLLLKNRELCSSLASTARENASQFSWSRIADQLELAYSPG
jgi:glycosyltransferase involved in cell wall biosynthesis